MKANIEQGFGQLTSEQQRIIRLALSTIYGGEVYERWGKTDLAPLYDQRLTDEQEEQGFLDGRFDDLGLLQYYFTCLQEDETVESSIDLLAKFLGIDSSIIDTLADGEDDMDPAELAEAVKVGMKTVAELKTELDTTVKNIQKHFPDIAQEVLLRSPAFKAEYEQPLEVLNAIMDHRVGIDRKRKTSEGY